MMWLGSLVALFLAGVGTEIVAGMGQPSDFCTLRQGSILRYMDIGVQNPITNKTEHLKVYPKGFEGYATVFAPVFTNVTVQYWFKTFRFEPPINGSVPGFRYSYSWAGFKNRNYGIGSCLAESETNKLFPTSTLTYDYEYVNMPYYVGMHVVRGVNATTGTRNLSGFFVMINYFDPAEFNSTTTCGDPEMRVNVTNTTSPSSCIVPDTLIPMPPELSL
eukprot:comp18919_c0_seq1/m.21104 comp18919_c0_seq1/g.21104  ORF comp18919_c0_seq1/g.21104 comp18919_c0_seq1/m.21104 type:complete len:218 (-) comp18919_c0_seq1:589-1242(-)